MKSAGGAGGSRAGAERSLRGRRRRPQRQSWEQGQVRGCGGKAVPVEERLGVGAEDMEPPAGHCLALGCVVLPTRELAKGTRGHSHACSRI